MAAARPGRGRISPGRWRSRPAGSGPRLDRQTKSRPAGPSTPAGSFVRSGDFIQKLHRPAHVRNDDGAADNQADAHGLDDFVARGADLDRLADVIADAVVAP